MATASMETGGAGTGSPNPHPVRFLCSYVYPGPPEVRV